jgi:PAS domain-containing protein
MVGELIGTLSLALGLAVSGLSLVLVWHLHRRFGALADTSTSIHEQLGRLERMLEVTNGAIVGVDPILEAVSEGAYVVGHDERVHSANRVAYARGWIVPGVSLAELAVLLDVRSLDHERFRDDRRPERRVLDGETVRDVIVRLQPEGSGSEVIVAVNGSPARDVDGRVIAAVMIARAVSEEVALAIQVRQMTDRAEHPPIPIGA